MVHIIFILFTFNWCSTLVNCLRSLIFCIGSLNSVDIIACTCPILHCMWIFSFTLSWLSWYCTIRSSNPVFSSSLAVFWCFWPASVLNVFVLNYLIWWGLLLEKDIVYRCFFQIHLLKVLWLSFFILFVIWDCYDFFSTFFLTKVGFTVVFTLRFIILNLVWSGHNTRINS